MGNRLSKIYTRTGDKGETGLGTNDRVSKADLRIEAIGTLDELNSSIGLVRAYLTDDDALQPIFARIQHDLFDLGGELAMPGFELLRPEPIAELEQHIDQFNEQLPPLKDFILPGGDKVTAHMHMARTICRRGERVLVAMAGDGNEHSIAMQYLNRLSDLLFVLGRVTGRREGGQEILWDSRLKEKE